MLCPFVCILKLEKPQNANPQKVQKALYIMVQSKILMQSQWMMINYRNEEIRVLSSLTLA